MAQLNKDDLESLLRPELGNDLVVESFTSKALTQPGENYGSTMLALEVNIVQDSTKRKQKLSLVAKLVPPSEFLWKMFNIPNTFCKEINCYTILKEEFEKLQKERGISKDKFLDIFPKCYGARTTLAKEIGPIADKNGVLLLENLKESNYCLGNRRLGLDLNHTKLAVSQLARFHAISIAIKLIKPQVFEQTILKAIRPFHYGLTKKEMEDNNKSLLESVMTIPEYKKHLGKLETVLQESLENYLKHYPEAKEPFGTIGHLDFWVNNMMFCYDTDKRPIGIKFIDFQLAEYISPARDLIFFLYSSTAEGVIENWYEMLIQLYHQNFISCLSDLGCDITPFSFQSFLDEIDEMAPHEINHILYMLRVMCGAEEGVKELADVRNDTLLPETNAIFENRAKIFLRDFVKRGWF
ncbi:hypothetical protein C0J52_07366 [Blattella germanica]|nr:hypothetical protein C0J52_07366 [Blattella germanica]